MLRYLLKRILLFIPTLLIISLIAFGLSRVPAGDPVTNCYDPGGEIASEYDYDYNERMYRQRAAILHTDLPPFYFALTARAYPDTLHRIVRKNHQETLSNLIAQYGNWPRIETYYQQIKTVERALLTAGLPSDPDRKSTALRELRQLPLNHRAPVIERRLSLINSSVQNDSLLRMKVGISAEQLLRDFTAVKEYPNTADLYLPALHFHGLDNQYHRWVSDFVRGDFGISCTDKRPVADKMREAVFWTLMMNVFAILLGYMVAVPLGVASAVRRGTRFDRVVSVGLFMLYSLPAFWVGTMALIFFATPEYGMQIFPGPGLGDSGAGAPFWTRFWERAAHLTLPILCLAYPSFAFLSRQMRGSMSDTLQKDFIRTARAKGLTEGQVIRRHGLRNSLFPIITLLASVFPRVLSGALVLEIIFNIPGMGKLAFSALLQQDWNLVFTVLMLSAVLTMVGILVADILYAWADPRVRPGEA